MDALGKLFGLLVFIGGIVLLVIVFKLTYDLFQNTEQLLVGDEAALREVYRNFDAFEAEHPGVSVPSPLIFIVTAAFAKFLFLLALGFVASLVAAKGAQLAGAYRGKSDVAGG